MFNKLSIKRTKGNIEKLEKLLKGVGRLLIILQNNPDPDAIASAVALRRVVNKLATVKSFIAHGGVVGRAENRALVKYLNITMHRIDDVDFDKFDLIALVDTQPYTGNNLLPKEILADIVIDHHPIRKATRKCSFTDIRSKYGSTGTILLEYLYLLEVEIDAPLATSLLYGIRSDTQDLGRDAIKADVEAMEFLFPLANKRVISEIQRGDVPAEYFRMLFEAIKHARSYGNVMVTRLGQINNPDMIGEIADLLLREDDTDWTMCTGIFGESLLISIRTTKYDGGAEKIIHKVVSRLGTGGGHQTYAGGQVPLKGKSQREINKIEDCLTSRLLKKLNADAGKGKHLLEIQSEEVKSE